MTENQKRFLQHLREFGLVYQRKVCGSHYSWLDTVRWPLVARIEMSLLSKPEQWVIL